MPFPPALLAVALFVGMLVCVGTGRRFSKNAKNRGDREPDAGLNIVEGSVFTLLGLVLAFTFSLAAGRLDARKDLAVDEANAIGTAVMRLDLLGEPGRTTLRRSFLAYTEARIEFNGALSGRGDLAAVTRRTSALQERIWTDTVAATDSNSRESDRVLLVPALNDVFDAAGARAVAARTHTPWLIVAMLFVLALLSAVLAGRVSEYHGWHPRLGGVVFALLVSFTVYVILDLDDPRNGLIRIDHVDRLLFETRESVKVKLGPQRR
ncbi:MAG: DUF4239 domain-containing protein [Armatimonadetes bacterium]|nr:DUF4239 domain-containing protein [Armatimonadota bacterium]